VVSQAPTTINGILTATAIIFGFVTLELREIKTSIGERFFLSVPLLFFMMLTLLSILDGVILDNMTVLIALMATINCLFNILDLRRYCFLRIPLYFSGFPKFFQTVNVPLMRKFTMPLTISVATS
jgi:hypothetical protein